MSSQAQGQDLTSSEMDLTSSDPAPATPHSALRRNTPFFPCTVVTSQTRTSATPMPSSLATSSGIVVLTDGDLELAFATLLVTTKSSLASLCAQSTYKVYQ